MTTLSSASNVSSSATWKAKKSKAPIYRVICPRCRNLILLVVAPADEEPVVCPRCHERFEPDEEELLDPEDA